MDVLILSKTHMNNGKCCIGGITDSGRHVRLLTLTGENQPENTDLNPRQVWEVEFAERPNMTPPHVEDVLVSSRNLKGHLKDEVTILELIKQRNIQIWRGSPDFLFDGKIQWTNGGSGFINSESIPEHSVGFWISDKDLLKKEFNGIRYIYSNHNSWRSLKFVGFQTAVDKLPKGTLLRVSLARWWQQDENTEERCYLQLSGWYDFNEILSYNIFENTPFG